MRSCSIGVRQIVNESCVKFNFSPLPVLCDYRALSLFTLCNHVRVSKDGPESTFHQLMIKTNTNAQGMKHVKHDEELSDSEVLVQIN